MQQTLLASISLQECPARMLHVIGTNVAKHAYQLHVVIFNHFICMDDKGMVYLKCEQQLPAEELLAGNTTAQWHISIKQQVHTADADITIARRGRVLMCRRMSMYPGMEGHS